MTSSNASCWDCSGDGYVIAEPFNPSERPYRMRCETCKGTGERKTDAELRLESLAALEDHRLSVFDTIEVSQGDSKSFGIIVAPHDAVHAIVLWDNGTRIAFPIRDMLRVD